MRQDAEDCRVSFFKRKNWVDPMHPDQISVGRAIVQLERNDVYNNYIYKQIHCIGPAHVT